MPVSEQIMNAPYRISSLTTLLLLVGLVACRSQPETSSVQINIEIDDWCDEALWQVPLDVRVDGRVITSIEASAKSTGILKVTPARYPSKIDVVVGKRVLADNSLYRPKSPNEAPEQLYLQSIVAHAAPPGLFPVGFPCQGKECLSQPLTSEKRSCTSEFHLRHVSANENVR